MAEVDVCVVGAGAGGGIAAWALVHRGLRVRLLETGPRFDPSSYRSHDPDWELRPLVLEEGAQDPARQSYESAPGEPLDAAYAHLRSQSFTAMLGDLERRLPFVWSRVLGVGGSTLHYQGEAHRFPAHAFRMRSELGVAEDWPVDYEELAPYYERVERLLDVAGDAGNPFKPAHGAFPHPAHPLSPASRHVGEAARRLGWQLLPNTLAVLRKSVPGRAACHYCNGCSRGCMVGAKSSVDVAVIPDAERTGRLELVTDFHVSRLDVAPDGRVAGVIGHDGAGVEQRHRAAAVVLATGAVETPRILLNSAGGAHPNGIGNDHDQVGRFLMELLYVRRAAVLDRSLRSYIGLPIDSRIWDWNGAAGRGEVPNGFALGQHAGVLEGPVGFAQEAVSGFGLEHREAVARGFGGGLELFGIVEQLPRADNRVVLSERTDRFGVPLARVETRLDRGDLDALSAAWKRLGELGEAAGAGEFVAQATAYDVPSATHAAGTCRMGGDPERSVVDASGAVHGHPNLVIADASPLVTQGAGDSPSLTIQALALRAAEALADHARRGET
ncbi:MAG: GMC family oxidoreductase [Myxococcota bacterium]|nr:GMC family oxidoreductase [Myxococcota bacterium]